LLNSFALEISFTTFALGASAELLAHCTIYRVGRGGAQELEDVLICRNRGF
jgi:hypothetical protein